MPWAFLSTSAGSKNGSRRTCRKRGSTSCWIVGEQAFDLILDVYDILHLNPAVADLLESLRGPEMR